MGLLQGGFPERRKGDDVSWYEVWAVCRALPQALRSCRRSDEENRC